MEKENILSLLKEYFKLDETINELSNKVNISFEKGYYCNEYIKIEKKICLDGSSSVNKKSIKKY